MVDNRALDWRVEQDLLVETITEDNLRQLLEKVIMNDAVITCMCIVIFTRFIQLLMFVHVNREVNAPDNCTMNILYIDCTCMYSVNMYMYTVCTYITMVKYNHYYNYNIHICTVLLF